MDQWHAQLQSALSGLLYSSESDYPLEFVHWSKPSDKALDIEFVRAQLKLGADEKIEEGNAQQFLDDCCQMQSWFSDVERNRTQDYQILRGLLKQNLSDMRLFRVGEIEVTVLLIGEDKNSDFSGFRTVSVET